MNNALRTASVSTARAETPTQHVRSLYYPKGLYTIPVKALGAFLGGVARSWDGNSSLAQRMTNLLAHFELAGRVSHTTIAQVGLDIETAVLNAAPEKITEVVTRALTGSYGQRIQIVGMLPGLQILVEGKMHTLNGHACPKCRLNPQIVPEGRDRARGITGRCLNAADCGWITQ